MKAIAYYVTAHGYGHGVRSCDILEAFAVRHPGVDIHVVSGLGESFFESRLAACAPLLRAESFDVGMVQQDAIRVDVDASLSKILDVQARNAERVETERAFLQANNIGVIVADIAGFPLAVAAGAGLPALAVGNFSWDWIYSPFVRRNQDWQKVVEQFRSEYSCADLLLRLPFNGDMSVFPAFEDVPLLASATHECRSSMAEKLGIDSQKTWVLMSFTALDWESGAPARLAELEDCVFLGVPPCEWGEEAVLAVDRSLFSFQQIIASVDVVVSKPGYGILSECIANQKPFIYVEREDFIEYPVLVDNIGRYLSNVHLPAADLYCGNLASALASIRIAAEPPETMSMGGAAIVADRIASFL